MGLLERAGRLGQAGGDARARKNPAEVERLAGPDQMGELFKVLATPAPGDRMPPFRRRRLADRCPTPPRRRAGKFSLDETAGADNKDGNADENKTGSPPFPAARPLQPASGMAISRASAAYRKGSTVD